MIFLASRNGDGGGLNVQLFYLTWKKKVKPSNINMNHGYEVVDIKTMSNTVAHTATND